MPECQHLGDRMTPHAVVRELALRARDSSIAMVGPVRLDVGDIGRNLILVGNAEPVRCWIELSGSTRQQIAELGDELRRTFASVETYVTDLALAEAVLTRWPLSSRAAQFVADERQAAGGA